MERCMMGKNRFSIRLVLPLLDRKEHELNEYYDWMTAVITPEVAIRTIGREVKGLNDSSLEDKVMEGRRRHAMQGLNRLAKAGHINVVYPEPAERRFDRGGTKGPMDPKKCKVNLTDSGWNHWVEKKNNFVKVLRELYVNLDNGIINLSIKYNTPVME